MKFSMFLPVVVCEVDQSTGISCHTGVLPHTVVMTRPPICTPSLLMVTALHMETCFVSLPLKHSWKCFLSSETASFLHLYLLLLIFSFFSALQIKSHTTCEFGAHMREMQQNLEWCHGIFQRPLCTPHYYAIFAAYK